MTVKKQKRTKSKSKSKSRTRTKSVRPRTKSRTKSRRFGRRVRPHCIKCNKDIEKIYYVCETCFNIYCHPCMIKKDLACMVNHLPIGKCECGSSINLVRKFL